MAANEADVIEAFVRHNLRFLDTLVVLDHCSLDSSRGVLGSLMKEGLPLIALAADSRAFRQDVFQTQLARTHMQRLGADFCFPLDADEFIKVESRAALEDRLSHLESGRFGLVSWENYVPAEKPADEPNILKRITRRPASARSLQTKVVLTQRFLADSDWHLNSGNHRAVWKTDPVDPMLHQPLAGVSLAHFPVRSAAQLTRKVLIGWLAHALADPEALKSLEREGQDVRAGHWRDLYEGILKGVSLDAHNLVRAAMHFYVQGTSDIPVSMDFIDDPLPVPFELKYTPKTELPPLVAVTRWAQGLVGEVVNQRP